MKLIANKLIHYQYNNSNEKEIIHSEIFEHPNDAKVKLIRYSYEKMNTCLYDAYYDPTKLKLEFSSDNCSSIISYKNKTLYTISVYPIHKIKNNGKVISYRGHTITLLNEFAHIVKDSEVIYSIPFMGVSPEEILNRIYNYIDNLVDMSI